MFASLVRIAALSLVLSAAVVPLAHATTRTEQPFFALYCIGATKGKVALTIVFQSGKSIMVTNSCLPNADAPGSAWPTILDTDGNVIAMTATVVTSYSDGRLSNLCTTAVRKRLITADCYGEDLDTQLVVLNVEIPNLR